MALRYARENKATVTMRVQEWQRATGYRHQRAWQKRNPDLVRAAKRRAQTTRRARKQAAFVEVVDPRVCLQRHDATCYLCDEPITGRYHIDHVVPLSRGGPHSYENCRPTHPSCNLSKQARLPSELA